MLMSAAESCLIVVDMQARLVPTMSAPKTTVDNARMLIEAAERLNVPILLSEQYSSGLGPTVPEVAELVPAEQRVEKMAFSCMGDPDFAARFHAVGRRQAVIAGVEAHVCVLQTAEDLLSSGVETFVVSDATSSRTERNHAAAMQRLGCSGARIVTTEMVVFEWLAKAGTAEFKELIALVK